MILIHRCVQLVLQILVLRGCFEHTFDAAIILCMRTIENGYWSTNTCCGCAQLRPPYFCQWHLGLHFCGCSNMSIFGSFYLGVGSAFVCVSGLVCAEWAERWFRLVTVTSQINKHPKNTSAFKLRFRVSETQSSLSF